MGKAFVKGDRVAVYDHQRELYGARATVVSFTFPDDLHVRLDHETKLASEPTVHPHQCRRLVKPKRREWWVHVHDDGSIEEADQKSHHERRRLMTVKVREARTPIRSKPDGN